ncbi:isoprenyl transferase [Timonella senegalensis]|uniref:isoprenyl transferase n=1 Tax=Timonella senegalensis TaxID=1465825 RepID=UPI0005924F5A|nr:isoprenyl transferase [Timonella senegalensis]
MFTPPFLYGIYEDRIARRLPRQSMPRHVGVILDGNRRWAKSFGETAATGHQRGADKISDFLGWSEELGVEVVTLWMLSTDNLRRESAELDALFGIIENAVRQLAETQRWRLRVVGKLDLLPEALAQSLVAYQNSTANVEGLEVNVAIGYGGRHEIADAVRSMLNEYKGQGLELEQIIEKISVEGINDHLYTKGQPDPELVIRTSGEQRLGGFLLWQSAKSEFYFCEAYWPDFRRVDYLRAMRAFASRERREGK